MLSQKLEPRFTDPASRRTVRLAGLVLWFAIFVGVAITTGRVHIRGDASQMCAVASAITEHGWFDIPVTRGDVLRGPDGKGYSKYPLMTVVQCLPALGLRNVGRALDAENTPSEWFFTGLTPAAVTATLGLFFFLLALEFGFGIGTGAYAAFAVVFATPIWAYGRELYSENIQAMFLLMLLWAVLLSERTKKKIWLVVAGVFAGLLLLLKSPHAMMPFVVLAMFWAQREPLKRYRDLVVFGTIGGLPSVVLFFAYNYLRFGDALDQGYGDPRTEMLGWSTPWYSGLHGLLFSPGKSVFLYAPIVAFGVIALPALWRLHRGAFLYVVLPSAVLFGLMSKWWSGLGDWGWGPRLVVPVIPLLVLPALFRIAHGRVWWRALAHTAVALGLFVNTLGIAIDHSQYIGLVSNVTTGSLQISSRMRVRDDLVIVHYVPEFSPIVGHLWMLDVYFNGWDSQTWVPWKSLNVPAWELRSDPTPPWLNSWSDGSALAWAVIGFGWLVVAGLVGILFALARRSRGPPVRSMIQTASVGPEPIEEPAQTPSASPPEAPVEEPAQSPAAKG